MLPSPPPEDDPARPGPAAGTAEGGVADKRAGRAAGDNAAFLAWLETVPDPDQRYNIATSALTEHQEMVTRLSAMRAGAVADASSAAPVSEVARRFGVSRQRAHQLLREAKSRAKPNKTTGGGTAGEEKENER